MSDYLTNELVQGNWAYPVYLEGDVSALPEYIPLATTILVERFAPINLVIGDFDQ